MKHFSLFIFCLGFSAMLHATESCNKPVNPHNYGVGCLNSKNLTIFSATDINSDELKGIMNSEGKIVIPNIYSHIEFSSEWEVGIDNPSPALILLIKYEGSNTESGYIAHDQYIFVDESGNVIVKPYIYQEAQAFSDGLARVTKDGLIGFIDTTGKVVIPIKYQDTDFGFSEGLVGVKINGKWGFIDKNDKIKITPKFDDVSFFREGTVIVGLTNDNYNFRYGMVDKNGKELLPLVYQKIESLFWEELYMIKKNGKWGVINSLGDIILPINFDCISLEQTDNDVTYIHAVKNQKIYKFNKYGKTFN